MAEGHGTCWRILEGVFSKRDHEFEIRLPPAASLGANFEIAARSCGSIGAELKVRIHSPPAMSHANHRFLGSWSGFAA